MKETRQKKQSVVAGKSRIEASPFPDIRKEMPGHSESYYQAADNLISAFTEYVRHPETPRLIARLLIEIAAILTKEDVFTNQQKAGAR